MTGIFLVIETSRPFNRLTRLLTKVAHQGQPLLLLSWDHLGAELSGASAVALEICAQDSGWHSVANAVVSRSQPGANLLTFLTIGLECCALAQGKTLLAGLPLRTLCGVPWAAQRTGPPVPACPVRIPLLRTVYSVVQFRNPGTNGGAIAGFQLHVCSITQGVKYDAFLFFASHCRLVRFGRACADGQREKPHCRGATGATSVPERRSERLVGFRPSGPTGHAHVVVDERHIRHFGALGGPRRRAGFYDSEAFSINHL